MSQLQASTVRRAGNNQNTAPRKFTGPVRIKHLPPTIEEAVIAAQGLADDLEGQVEIAAGLMGMKPDEVRAEVTRMAQERQVEEAKPKVMVRDRSGAERTVVVQRSGRMTRAATTERRTDMSTPRSTAIVERTRPAVAGRLTLGKVRTFDLTR